MGKKQSSFSMGYEFNGYGDKVYIKAGTCKTPHVSQENVQLTPDYSGYVLKANGGNAIILNPENINAEAKMMLGSLASVNNVSLTKNTKGTYSAGIKVAANGLTDNSSLIRNSEKKVQSEKYYVQYFVVTGGSGLNVRSIRSSKDSSSILTSIQPGEQINVEYMNGYPVSGLTEDDSEALKWVKVVCEVDGTEKEGWVPRIYVREDRKRVVMFNEIYDYSKVLISWVRKGETTKNEKPVNAFHDWYAFGDWDLKSKEVCPKTDGRWRVQVGPSVLDWEYPLDGTLGQKEEFTGFSKYIDVYLSLKEPDKTKPQERVLKCIVWGLKAHTFHQYEYDDKWKNYQMYDESHFKSDYVTSASATVIAGLVQTGIRYPNADNGSVVSEKNTDGSIIEFYGGPNTDFGFTLSEYSLVEIVVNDDKTTRGKKMGESI